MSFQLTKLPQKLPPLCNDLHQQVLYNAMYGFDISSAQFAVSSPDGKAQALQQKGKPLWMRVEKDQGTESLRTFFDVCLYEGIKGLIAEKWVVQQCPQKATHIWDIVALYLPQPLPPSPLELVYPTISDIPMMEEWVSGFYKEALTTIPPADIAKSLVQGKKLYALQVKEQLVSMGMLIPLQYNMSRLNFIYTPPNFRGRGYGKMVATMLAKKAQEVQNLPVLYARVDNTQAYNMYKSIGFVEAGRLVELRF